MRDLFANRRRQSRTMWCIPPLTEVVLVRISVEQTRSVRSYAPQAVEAPLVIPLLSVNVEPLEFAVPPETAEEQGVAEHERVEVEPEVLPRGEDVVAQVVVLGLAVDRQIGSLDIVPDVNPGLVR